MNKDKIELIEYPKVGVYLNTIKRRKDENGELEDLMVSALREIFRVENEHNVHKALVDLANLKILKEHLGLEPGDDPLLEVLEYHGYVKKI